MGNNKQKQVISLRLAPELARAFKVEAASQGLKLNALFEKMMQVYLGKAVNENSAKYNNTND